MLTQVSLLSPSGFLETAIATKVALHLYTLEIGFQADPEWV